MRVAISVDDSNGLDSVVSAHFGRCPYYVLVDLDGQEVEQVNTVANPNYGQHAPGTVPAFIKNQGADVMLAGGMGRRAVGLFQQYGIQAATGAVGSVRYALEQYLGGVLREAEPCSTSLRHGHEEPSIEGEYERDEVGRLQEDAERMQQQLDDAMKRLARLTASEDGSDGDQLS
jgi:predicted Fe-Mo cluster-binding NifX family protein